MHRLQLLADSLQQRLRPEKDAAAAGSAAPLSTPASQPAATVEQTTAASTPESLSSLTLASAPSPAAASPASSSADVSMSSPLPVRRPAFTFSKPPSQPTEASRDNGSAPASQPADVAKRGREEASSPEPRRVKPRRQQRVGAVHAMIDRWKAVRNETAREEQQAEAARGGEEAERIAHCEQQVRRAAAEAGRDNPNLAPLGDWRARVRAARERQRSTDTG
jgi:hypothetical protein